MHPLELSAGISPLEFRAEQLEQHGIYTYDLVLSHWRCQRCKASVPGAAPMGLPLISYRSVEEFHEGTLRAAMTAYRQTELPSCSACGHTATLELVEHHAFLSSIGRDLVARVRPDQEGRPSLWFWSRAHGYVPVVALSLEQRAAFTRDALLRAIAAHRDFDEPEEAFAVLSEALQTIPGDAELLRWVPWLSSLGLFSLAGPVAQAHVEAHPDDPRGHFWLGQVYLELVATGTWSTQDLSQAEDAFRRTLELSPNHTHADAELGLVNIERARGHTVAAMERLHGLLLRHPDQPEALYTKGLMLLDTDPRAALDCFERGAELRPNDPDYFRGIERARAALGEQR